MIIPDESERAARMAGLAFAGPRNERPFHEEQLRLFCFLALDAGRAELLATGSVSDAVDAAVAAYQDDRRSIIAYRRKAGLPVEGDE